MDSKAAVIASSWFAVAIISALYIWVGGVNLWTNIAVALLVLAAFVVTIVMGFGLEVMHEQRPSSKALVQMSTELTEIKSTINELARKVDEIQKELQE
jgi:apolipoprotein N-acyltransferase